MYIYMNIYDVMETYTTPKLLLFQVTFKLEAILLSKRGGKSRQSKHPKTNMTLENPHFQ